MNTVTLILIVSCGKTNFVATNQPTAATEVSPTPAPEPAPAPAVVPAPAPAPVLEAQPPAPNKGALVKPPVVVVEQKPPLEASFEVVDLCKQVPQKVTQKIAFIQPTPPPPCAWDEAGNMPFDGRDIISAISEEKISLTVPSDAIICDIQFAFANQSMLFDDEIFLTFNGVVLFTSDERYVGPTTMPIVDGLALFDKNKIFGRTNVQGIRPYFIDPTCGADCSIPVSQTPGVAKMRIAPEI